MSDTTPFAKPPRLLPGDRVAVVAPAGPIERESLEAGLGVLAGRYEATWEPELLSRVRYLAGDDARRAGELCAALGDPRAKAVIAARGGYGSLRLLPRLWPSSARDGGPSALGRAKLVVGFSDITALHCALQAMGQVSVHGPSVNQLATQPHAVVERFFALLEDATAPPPRIAGTPLVGGVVEGPLLGGNLSLLTRLLGTPWLPDLEGAVLLLEDVTERPYRLDRMWTHLRLTGVLDTTATLTLDPELKLPDWYTEWDIHLQPGGVWSSDVAARVYELGARLVMLGANDDYAFHHLFVDTAVPRRDYRRIVDLGCGFGKSTWPLKEAFREAEVIGIDLAAPCLRLAAERASERRLAIEFRQADALDTGLESGSADLVTSTMLLHELPVSALPRVFGEASRLLRAGGTLEFLDFHTTGDAFRDLAMLEHGTRNNEPYMAPMMAEDLPAMARAAGLANARWSAFDERGAGRLAALTWPARAEWHFPWAVLQAEKPR